MTIDIADSALNPALAAALPHPLFDGLSQTLTQTPPTVAIRLNPRKGLTHEDFGDNFDGRVAWCHEGLYLKTRPAFTFDPSLHQGRYYVQDAASMAVGTVIGEIVMRLGGQPLTVLDACAAPGGKTLSITDALPAGSLVVANEFDFRRAEILKENIAKWGAETPVIVSRGDTARFRKLLPMFDVILVDAPCSGEGMMRKDPVARSQWTPALVKECAARQREILDNIWGALRPGGYLVYSTCTFNTAENEEQIARFAADNDAAFIPLPLKAGAHGIAGSLITDVEAARFTPGKTRSEGLFVSAIQKPGSQAGQPAAIKKSKPTKKSKTIPGVSQIAKWLNTEGIEFISRGDAVEGIPAAHIKTVQALQRELDIISIATEIATLKGRDFIPSQALAMSAILAPDAFQHVETDNDTALAYLRREAVTLGADTPRGFILLTHNGYPLGFVKNMGNRSNNLYPAPWRILSRQQPR